MDPDWTFCGECGTPVPVRASSQPMAPPRPQAAPAPSWGSSGNTLQSFQPPEVSGPTNVSKNRNDSPPVKTIPLSQAQAKFGSKTGGGGHRRSLSVGEGAEPSMTYSNVGTRNDFNQPSSTPSWGQNQSREATVSSTWGSNQTNNNWGNNQSTLVSSRGGGTIATFNPEMPTIKKGSGGTLFTFSTKKSTPNSAPPKPKPPKSTGPKGEPPAVKIFNFVSKKVGEAKEATRQLEQKQQIDRQAQFQKPQQSWGGNTTNSSWGGHNSENNNTTGSWGGHNSENNNTTGSWGGHNSANNNTTGSWGGHNSANNATTGSWGGHNSANDTTASSFQSFAQPSSNSGNWSHNNTNSSWGNNTNQTTTNSSWGNNTNQTMASTTNSSWGNNNNQTMASTTNSSWGNNQSTLSSTTHSIAQKPPPTTQTQSGPPKISAKQEEEYIKNHEGRRQIDDYYERKRRQSILSKTVDPTQCYCSLQMGQAEIRMKGTKQDFVAFRIDITFDQSSWSIFRRWKQFVSMDHVFSKEVYGYQKSMPNVDKQAYGGKHAKFNPNFIELRRSGLQTYLNIVIAARNSIFSSRNGGNAFFKFIAPVQLGDIKPKGFIMPFKLTL